EQIIRSITRKWKTKYCREKEVIGLDAAERSECIKVVRIWIGVESQHKLANALIDQLLDDFHLFYQRDPNEIMNFVSSEEGLELFHFLQQINQKIKVSIFDHFCHWSEQLCGNIVKGSVSVATMEMLLTNARLEKLLKLWEGIVNSDATIDINRTRDLAKKYEQVKASRKLLETFFKRSSIGLMWFGNELQALHELSMQMTTAHNWYEITLQQALTYDRPVFQIHKSIFDTFDKIQLSDIALSMWKAMATEKVNMWSIAPLSQYDTYRLCEWVRESEAELLKDIANFDLEKYVHHFFENDIDGSKVETDEWNEQKLLTALFPNKRIDTISNDEKTVTSRLWLAIQTKKEKSKKLLRKYSPTQRQFRVTTIKEILKDLRSKWDTAKKELSDQTMTGLRISNDFGLLRTKSEQEIFHQIRLMYEPQTTDQRKLSLSAVEEKDLEKLPIYMPKQIDPSPNELQALQFLLATLEFSMPQLLNGSGSLSPQTFITEIKRVLTQMMESSKDTPKKCSDIPWGNIVERCGISKEMEGWIKFVGYKVLLKNFEYFRHKITNYQNLAKCLKQVFSCFDSCDALKLLRDATLSLCRLYKDSAKLGWEDKDWQANKSFLKSFDNESMKVIVQFWEQNQQHLPKVPSVGVEWLRIIVSSNKIMKECFETFRNNQVFEDHMQNFAENDSVQQARGTSLMEVRRYLVNFLTSNFDNMSAMYNQLLHFAQHEMNAEKLECFKIIRSAWDSIVQDAVDPQSLQRKAIYILIFFFKKKGWMHQKDKEMLKKIQNVHFGDEKQMDKEKYMEIEYLTEETSKEAEEKSKMQKEPKKQMKRMSQEEFEQLTDRLLMFITGDAGGTDNEVLTSQKGISVMAREDIEELLKRRQKQMAAMGPDVFKVVLDRIRTQAIDGQKLIASLKKSAKALGELLLGQDFDVAINREQLVTELMKIIDFEILKEREKNDLIPKFDNCKSIAKKRLEYFGLGGRHELEIERTIEFSRSIDKFEAIDNQWDLCLKKWISDISEVCLFVSLQNKHVHILQSIK
ncbi:hypothetical protein RFI_36786, partial [Reticulomyxa filosa]